MSFSTTGARHAPTQKPTQERTQTAPHNPADPLQPSSSPGVVDHLTVDTEELAAEAAMKPAAKESKAPKAPLPKAREARTGLKAFVPNLENYPGRPKTPEPSRSGVSEGSETLAPPTGKLPRASVKGLDSVPGVRSATPVASEATGVESAGATSLDAGTAAANAQRTKSSFSGKESAVKGEARQSFLGRVRSSFHGHEGAAKPKPKPEEPQTAAVAKPDSKAEPKPVVATQAIRDKEFPEIRDDFSVLHAVLHDGPARAAFLEFTEKRRMGENLAFLEACHSVSTVSQTATEEEINALLQKIFTVFLDDTAKTQVNLPAPIKSTFTTFDDAGVYAKLNTAAGYIFDFVARNAVQAFTQHCREENIGALIPVLQKLEKSGGKWKGDRYPASIPEKTRTRATAGRPTESKSSGSSDGVASTTTTSSVHTASPVETSQGAGTPSSEAAKQ
jgi:hypothetical protein